MRARDHSARLEADSRAGGPVDVAFDLSLDLSLRCVVEVQVLVGVVEPAEHAAVGEQGRQQRVAPPARLRRVTTAAGSIARCPKFFGEVR